MKNATNKALLKKLIGTSLDEVFVITAIEKYCLTVMEDETDWGDRSLIDQQMWRVIAKQNLATMKAHYK